MTSMINRALSSACLLIFLSANAVSYGQTFTIVRDGRPTSVIVTNGRPRECQTLAAEELQTHIRLISGATLPVVTEAELESDSDQTLILVGSGNRTRTLGIDTAKLDPETFVVKTVGNALILAGEDGGSKSNARSGTLWAAYDFLQDQLGCRWIWPGEIGRVVPKRSTISIGNLDIQETPQIKVRGFRMVCQEKHRQAYQSEGLGEFFEFGSVYDQLSEDERTWLQRMRMGRSFKLSYGHAFTDWWEKYHASDPDIFALQANGKRQPRKSSQPDFVKMCVSSPRLWELQLAPIREYAKRGATGLWINACENDGSGGFCMCSRCRAWDAPAGDGDDTPVVEDGSDVDGGISDGRELPESLSDRYARWYNELAVRGREFDPQCRVIAYAYSRYRTPPTHLDHIEPNVWIGYVGFNAYPRSVDYQQQSMHDWAGWSDLGATVFLRSNSMFYFGEGAPLVATQQLAEDFQFQVAHGLRAVDFDCLQGNWATAGPSYYVLARLLWDMDANVDQLQEEYYESFGKLAPAVRDYFAFWEDASTRFANTPAYADANRTERLLNHSQFYTETLFDAAHAILKRAQLHWNDASPAEQERFRNLLLGLQHGRLLVTALSNGKTSLGQPGQELLAFRRKIATRNVINVYWTTSKEKRYRVFD